MAKSLENCEVIGSSILGVINGLGAFRSQATRLLDEHGLPTEPQPDQWIPMQPWIDVLNALGKKVGPTTLYNVGKKTVEVSVFPPDLDTVEKVLSIMDTGYQMNHRGPRSGRWTYSMTSEKSATVVFEGSHPCDFVRGILDALVNKGSKVTVTHAEGSCAKTGGSNCSYNIKW